MKKNNYKKLKVIILNLLKDKLFFKFEFSTVNFLTVHKKTKKKLN